MTINVKGPDGSNFAFPDDTPEATITSSMASHYGEDTPAAPAAAAAAYDRNDPRFSRGAEASGAALRGVPIFGGLTEKAGAGISALAHPLTGVGSDKPSLAERYVENLQQENAAKADYEKEHPIEDTAAGLIGGTIALGGAGGASPAIAKGLGMTGKLVPAATRGAISGAGIGAVDAAVRGEDPISGAEVSALTGAGGVIGGKAVGKIWDAATRTFRAPPTVPTRAIDVNGIKVPVRESAVTGDLATSQEEQAVIHGARGDEASRMAQAHTEATDAALGQAHDQFAGSLDPTGAAPRTSPQAAGETVSSELASQEAQRAAAEAARLQSVGAERTGLRDQLAPPTVAPVHADPRTASEGISQDLQGAAQRAGAARDRAYEVLRETPGEFNPESLRDTAHRVRESLSTGSDPVNVSDTLTPHTAAAIRDIDRNVGQLRFENQAEPVLPERPPGAPPAASSHAQTVADIREKFGPDVAAAYDRQHAPAPASAAPPTAPKTHSLLEFLASKGGLGPDAELDAIGAHTHTVNVEGAGRRKLVKQGGWPLDYAREAAEEAGYLRGDHKGTSGVNDLLDAIDAEIRGSKRYPEGFEGHVGKREAGARSEREQHEIDAHRRGLEDDLAAAGHGELHPDVRERAARLMDSERMDPDTAVEHAMRQLEQEDAAGHHGAGFPGDRPPPAAPAPTSGKPITADTISEARKRLVSMQREAASAARRTGDFSDVRGMRRVIAAFEDHVARVARSPEGFTGDAEEFLRRHAAARESHAALKRTFGPRNPQDDVGKAIEKIVGKRDVTPAEMEKVAPMLFGSDSEPGGALQVRIARRIRDVFGENSRAWQNYRQGLISHLTESAPGLEPMSNDKIADRIHRFFSGAKGAGLAQELFSPSERAQFLAHANRLRTAADPAAEGEVEKTLARWSGRNGGERASAKTVIDGLMGESGKVGKAPQLVNALKRRLSPQGMTQLKQGVWSRITEPAEGKVGWQDQKQGQRIMEFLHGDGKGLADALFTKAEREAMENIGKAHIKMVPVPGSTNPSGSAHAGARLARGAAHSILPFLGLHMGGLPGVGAALAIKKGAGVALDRRAAAKASQLFYGPQATRAPARLPQGFGALGGALVANQSR